MQLPFKKISTVVIGRTFREIFNHLFDYILYPFVLLKLGYLLGLLVMTCLAAIENSIMLVIYNKMKIDWLGYEYVTKVKDWANTKTGFKRIVGVVLNKSDIILFLFLSTVRDSFETTAYFQHGKPNNKIRSGLIFISAIIVGNIYWSLGVEIFINSWLRHVFNW